MPITLEAMAKPVLVGRSSSVFTRVARIFAIELGIDHAFRVVPDLLATEAERYGGNPALKLPTLLAPSGSWFGSLTICRELARLSRRTPITQGALHLVWPEDLLEPVLANAQELTLQAMTTEVALIMSKQGGHDVTSVYQRKLTQSLHNTMDWLDEHVADLGAGGRPGSLSYLEVTLFCLVRHLEFREVLPVAGYRGLAEFGRAFSERSSAAATEYHYD